MPDGGHHDVLRTWVLARPKVALANGFQRASVGCSRDAGTTLNRQLKRMAAAPRQLSRSGISPNKTTPPTTAITKRSNVYGARLKTLARLTATIPRYIP